MRHITISRLWMAMLCLGTALWYRQHALHPKEFMGMSAETSAEIDSVVASAFALAAAWHVLLWVYGALVDFAEWRRRQAGGSGG